MYIVFNLQCKEKKYRNHLGKVQEDKIFQMRIQKYVGLFCGCSLVESESDFCSLCETIFGFQNRFPPTEQDDMFLLIVERGEGQGSAAYFFLQSVLMDRALTHLHL